MIRYIVITLGVLLLISGIGNLVLTLRRVFTRRRGTHDSASAERGKNRFLYYINHVFGPIVIGLNVVFFPERISLLLGDIFDMINKLFLIFYRFLLDIIKTVLLWH